MKLRLSTGGLNDFQGIVAVFKVFGCDRLYRFFASLLAIDRANPGCMIGCRIRPVDCTFLKSDIRIPQNKGLDQGESVRNDVPGPI